MRISLQWLSEWIGGPLPAPKDLAARLTMAGLEIEGVEAANGRFIVGVQCHPERQESTPDTFERLFAARDPLREFVHTHRAFQPLRSNPRFQALEKQIGLPKAPREATPGP